MARPKKTGLSYFPLDVDVFEDVKLFDVQNRYGAVGEMVYLRLLCFVYKHGYYFAFDNTEKLSLLLIRSLGGSTLCDREKAIEIIRYIVDCGLFDKELFEKNILTSAGIQKRYEAAVGRRSAGINEYDIIGAAERREEKKQSEKKMAETSENLCFPDANSENENSYCSNNEGLCSNNSTNKSKVNKSKENKSKINKSRVCASLPCLSGILEIDQELYETLTHTYKNIDIQKSMKKLNDYLSANPDRQRPREQTLAYMHMWLDNDNDRAAKAQKPGNYYAPTYDIEEYEMTSAIPH